MISSNTIGVWDRAGMIVSAVCLLHCLILPFAFLVLSAITHLETGGEWLHILCASLAVPVAGLALNKGYKTHHSIVPLYLAFSGAALLWGALLLHDPHWLEKTVSSVGAALLGLAHIINYRLFCCCKGR